MKIAHKIYSIHGGISASILFRAITVLIIIAAFLLEPKTPASAQTLTSDVFYVSVNGSDANPGTLDQPWRTLTYATQRLHAGETLYIRGGTYQERFSITASGTSSNPILLTSYNNEEVIIDGMNNTLPQRGSGTPLIGIWGDWVTVSNLTIQYSGDKGVFAKGKNVTLDNLYVHHNWAGGVILSGDYDLIQNSRIWYNSTLNENNQSSSGWGSGVSCARYPDHCTIRHTIVWENWGEGISTYEALHTIIEDNVTYDNQQNIYISDTKYTIVQRNLSYCTPNNRIDMYSTQNGILVGDEKGVPIPLGSSGARYPSSDNVFVNNLGIGCNHNLAAGTKESNNNLYAFNTFVNAAGSTTEKTNILFYSGTTTNARFVNNIVVQEDDRAIAMIAGSGVTFSNNLWSKSPPPQADNPNNVIGDPALAKSESPYSPEWFEILVSSPAINRAIRIDRADEDFFGHPRGNLPDIGAFEYSSYVEN